MAARPPTNKAQTVLALLREGGERTCKDIAEEIMDRTLCGHCNGTGEGDDHRVGCRRCWGRGRAPFYYHDAYIALKQLMARRLVRRRSVLDEWGDETPRLVYSAVEQALPDPDALEALYLAPAAPERET